jgi:hypothetical protein
MPAEWKNMRMASGANAVSTSRSAIAKCWPWNPPTNAVPTSSRVAL